VLKRWQGLLASLWLGQMFCVAALVAPTAFASLERAQAGVLMRRVFELDAQFSLAAGLLLVLMARRLQRDVVPVRTLTAELLLPLAALLATVAGYFGLQPMMEAARMGQGALSFGALHAVSSAFYAIKGLAVLALAWRLSRPIS